MPKPKPTLKTEFSTTEICAIFGVSRTTMNDWGRRNCPRTKKGNDWFYNSAELFKWKIKYEREMWEDQYGVTDSRDLQDRLDNARFKHQSEQARAVKMKNDVKEGLLLYETEVRSALREVGLAHRLVCDAIKKSRTPATIEKGADIDAIAEKFAEELGKRVKLRDEVVVDEEKE